MCAPWNEPPTQLARLKHPRDDLKKKPVLCLERMERGVQARLGRLSLFECFSDLDNLSVGFFERKEEKVAA